MEVSLRPLDQGAAGNGKGERKDALNGSHNRTHNNSRLEKGTEYESVLSKDHQAHGGRNSGHSNASGSGAKDGPVLVDELFERDQIELMLQHET